MRVNGLVFFFGEVLHRVMHEDVGGSGRNCSKAVISVETTNNAVEIVESAVNY